MNNMTQPNFADGIYYNSPHEKAKSFMKGKISIEPNKFIEWLKQNQGTDKYVNLGIFISKKDPSKTYISLDNYKKPETKQEPESTKTSEEFGTVDLSEIPF